MVETAKSKTVTMVGRSFPLIQYADFMEHLADVISQSDNWDEAFGSIFRNKARFLDVAPSGNRFGMLLLIAVPSASPMS